MPSSTTSLRPRFATTSTRSASADRHGSVRPSASSITTASPATSATGPHPGTTAHRVHPLSTSTMPRSASVLVRLGAWASASPPSPSRTTGSSSTVVASATSPYMSRTTGTAGRDAAAAALAAPSSSSTSSPAAFLLARSSSASTRALAGSVSTTSSARSSSATESSASMASRDWRNRAKARQSPGLSRVKASHPSSPRRCGKSFMERASSRTPRGSRRRSMACLAASARCLALRNRSS
uniref:Uncharacterized protein n=1 Tax=Oryza rufipogon TaxID=4529 RepID=A0A0E0QZQ5_ORYRU